MIEWNRIRCNLFIVIKHNNEIVTFSLSLLCLKATCDISCHLYSKGVSNSQPLTPSVNKVIAGCALHKTCYLDIISEEKKCEKVNKLTYLTESGQAGKNKLEHSS